MQRRGGLWLLYDRRSDNLDAHHAVKTLAEVKAILEADAEQVLGSADDDEAFLLGLARSPHSCRCSSSIRFCGRHTQLSRNTIKYPGKFAPVLVGQCRSDDLGLEGV